MSTEEYRDVVIVGAGPTGLGAASRFMSSSSSTDWLLVDSADEAGGLACTDVTPEGFLFDMGGHVIFSHFDYFDELLDEACGVGPEVWAVHERVSYVCAPQTSKLYRPIVERRYSRAVSLSVTEKMDIFGGKKKTLSNRTWWTCLPSKILSAITAEIELQSQKHSSIVVECYDVINVIWRHVYDYYEGVRAVLENLFVFLEAITAGPMDPMFSTILLSFLEGKGTPLTVEHKLLSAELISLSTQQILDATSFTDTILGKSNIYLTGLHILFEDNPRLLRELRREGIDLLDKFKSNFIKHELDGELSSSSAKEMKGEIKTYLARNVRRLTVSGRGGDLTTLISQGMSSKVFGEASSYLDEESSYYSNIGNDSSTDSAKQYDVLLSYSMFCFDEDGVEVKHDAELPYFLKSFDIYCAHVAMKCLADLNQVTRSICPLGEIDMVATCTHHRALFLSRQMFDSWVDFTDRRLQKKINGEGGGDSSSDENEDDDASPFPSPDATGRRTAKSMKVFTIKE